MTIQEWITEAEMYEYSADNYNMTKLLGEIELTEMAIRSYELIQSNTVYTEGVELLNVFNEAEETQEETTVTKTKETLWDKVKKAWAWICEKIGNMFKAIGSFFTGKSKTDKAMSAQAQGVEDALDGMDFSDMDDGSSRKKSDNKSGNNTDIQLDDVDFSTIEGNVPDHAGDIENEILTIVTSMLGNNEMDELYIKGTKKTGKKKLEDLKSKLQSIGVKENEFASIDLYFEICFKCKDQTYIPSYMKTISEISESVANTIASTDINDPTAVSNKIAELKANLEKVKKASEGNKWQWVDKEKATAYIGKGFLNKSSIEKDVASSKGKLLDKSTVAGARKAIGKDTVNGSDSLANGLKEMHQLTASLMSITAKGVKTYRQAYQYEQKVISKCDALIKKIQDFDVF